MSTQMLEMGPSSPRATPAIGRRYRRRGWKLIAEMTAFRSPLELRPPAVNTVLRGLVRYLSNVGSVDFHDPEVSGCLGTAGHQKMGTFLDGSAVLIALIDADGEDFERFLAEAKPIVDSIRFDSASTPSAGA